MVRLTSADSGLRGPANTMSISRPWFSLATRWTAPTKRHRSVHLLSKWAEPATSSTTVGESRASDGAHAGDAHDPHHSFVAPQELSEFASGLGNLRGDLVGQPIADFDPPAGVRGELERGQEPFTTAADVGHLGHRAVLGKQRVDLAGQPGPQADQRRPRLDSLYGAGPTDSGSVQFYAPDGFHLKVGKTAARDGIPEKEGFDLPRGAGLRRRRSARR